MTVDDLDDILAPARWAAGRCHVAQALERIDDDQQRAKVTAAARNDQIRWTQVRAAFEHLLGYAPSESPIRRHRQGACACP